MTQGRLGEVGAVLGSIAGASVFAWGAETERWLPMVLVIVTGAALLVVRAVQRRIPRQTLVLSAITLTLLAAGTALMVVEGAPAI